MVNQREIGEWHLQGQGATSRDCRAAAGIGTLTMARIAVQITRVQFAGDGAPSHYVVRRMDYGGSTGSQTLLSAIEHAKEDLLRLQQEGHVGYVKLVPDIVHETIRNLKDRTHHELSDSEKTAVSECLWPYLDGEGMRDLGK